MFISKNIVIKVRQILLKTHVCSIALYGSEPWTLCKIEQKRLLVFETWCYRKCLRISWTEHIKNITNEEVYQRVGEIRNFLKTLKTKKAKLIGCHDSLRPIRPPLDYISKSKND